VRATSGFRNPIRRWAAPLAPSVKAMRTTACDLVLPCRDEAPALRALLPQVPAEFAVIVVDNGSSDDTSAVAHAHGARVVHEARPGYGAAVHAGLDTATSRYVAVMDGDGSFDPADLPRLLAPVVAGDLDLALGRRRPADRRVWPWHARTGNAAVVWWLRRSAGFPVHDLAPMRVCRREALLGLDVQDRRFGYPLELLRKASAAGWRLGEYDVTYRPRSAGTRSKVSGSVRGTLRTAHDFAKVLAT
jgi:glycosyltransferase involved in cell wall biosynthesis